jgi:uncharacterized protein YndB with AHSA1/START domain
MSGDVETVERLIPVAPEQIFALIADPSRHHEFDGSGTVRQANAVPDHLGLGSTFGMDMKVGLLPYKMVSTVIEYEENRRLAWQTRPNIGVIGLIVGGRIWRYELVPQDGGTLVKESWDISHERIKAMVAPLRQRTREAMIATLERIEKVLAAQQTP